MNGDLHFFCFWSGIHFLGKFSPKNQNCLSKLKFGTYTNRTCKIQWWYSLFPLLIGNTLFGQIWSKKLKLSVQGKTLYLNWFKYAEFNSDVHFFRFGRKYSDWDNFFQSIKIISWSWNSVPILIRICKIQWWYSLFLFMIRRTLFGQIWSKKLKLPVQGETLDLN